MQNVINLSVIIHLNNLEKRAHGDLNCKCGALHNRHSSCLHCISDSEARGRCPSDYNLLQSCMSLSKFCLWWRRETRLSWGKKREGRPWWIFSIQDEADYGKEEPPDSHFKDEQRGLFSLVICGAISYFFQPPSHRELLKWNLNIRQCVAGIEKRNLQLKPAQRCSSPPHVAPPSLLSPPPQICEQVLDEDPCYHSICCLLIIHLRTTAANSSCELCLAMQMRANVATAERCQSADNMLNIVIQTHPEGSSQMCLYISMYVCIHLFVPIQHVGWNSPYESERRANKREYSIFILQCCICHFPFNLILSDTTTEKPLSLDIKCEAIRSNLMELRRKRIGWQFQMTAGAFTKATGDKDNLRRQTTAGNISLPLWNFPALIITGLSWSISEGDGGQVKYKRRVFFFCPMRQRFLFCFLQRCNTTQHKGKRILPSRIS